MKVAALGNPGSWYCEELARAARECGHEFTRLDFPALVASVAVGQTRFACGDSNLSQLDGLIVRTMAPGTLEQVVYRMNVLGQLAEQGTIVLNSPRSIECAVDKYLTTARLQAARIPVPATIVCERAEDALEAFEQLGGDVVVKPIFGAEGRGIVRVSDPDLAWRAFRTIERLDAVIYLQRFVSHSGWDLRLLVLDGEVMGGIRRSARNGFRTNVAQHGLAESYTPRVAELRLALDSAAAVDATFAGVDLIYEGDDCFVLEVNAVPGWRAFQRVTGIDVAHRVIRFIEKQRLTQHA